MNQKSLDGLLSNSYTSCSSGDHAPTSLNHGSNDQGRSVKESDDFGHFLIIILEHIIMVKSMAFAMEVLTGGFST